MPYLSADAIERTLRAISAIPGGEVVFDYPSSDPGVSAQARELRTDLLRRTAAVGEPIRTSYRPAELAILLRGLGFDEVQDMGRAEFRDRYFPHRPRPDPSEGGGHILRARCSSE